MPRKTWVAEKLPQWAGFASMRPRPDAAENADADDGRGRTACRLQ